MTIYTQKLCFLFYKPYLATMVTVSVIKCLIVICISGARNGYIPYLIAIVSKCAGYDIERRIKDSYIQYYIMLYITFIHRVSN